MQEETIKISLVGDILLHSDYDRLAIEKGPFFVFEKVAPYLRNSDIRFGNLECVLSDKGAANPLKGCLKGDPRYIQALKEAGFDVLSLANNHVLDFGVEAFQDMADALEKAGIRIVGAGRNLEESRRPISVEMRGIRLGFLAYSSRDNGGYNYASDTEPGVAPLDEEGILADIEKHKDAVDHLLVSLHWGIEYSPYPTPHQVAMARKLVDAGARVIIGHHPRILQGYEQYHGGVILYSIGDLCHSDLHLISVGKEYRSELRLCEREIAIFDVYFSKDQIGEVEVSPFWLNKHGQPELCDHDKASQILEKVAKRSKVLDSPQFEKYWESLLVKKRVWGPVREWWRKGSLWEKIRNFNLSQLHTIYILLADLVSAKLSRRPEKWLMFSTRNDKKSRPFCGDEKSE